MLARAAALASIAGFLFGYDLGLIGGAMHGIRKELGVASDAGVQVVVAAAKLGVRARLPLSILRVAAAAPCYGRAAGGRAASRPCT